MSQQKKQMPVSVVTPGLPGNIQGQTEVTDGKTVTYQNADGPRFTASLQVTPTSDAVRMNSGRSALVQTTDSANVTTTTHLQKLSETQKGKQREDHSYAGLKDAVVPSSMTEELDIMISQFPLSSLPDDEFVSDILNASSGLFEHLPSPPQSSTACMPTVTSQKMCSSASTTSQTTTAAAVVTSSNVGTSNVKMPSTLQLSVGEVVAAATEHAIGKKSEGNVLLRNPQLSGTDKNVLKEPSKLSPGSSYLPQTAQPEKSDEISNKGKSLSGSLISWRPHKDGANVDANKQTAKTHVSGLKVDGIHTSWKPQSDESAHKSKEVSPRVSDAVRLLFPHGQSLLSETHRPGTVTTKEPGELDHKYSLATAHGLSTSPPGPVHTSTQRQSVDRKPVHTTSASTSSSISTQRPTSQSSQNQMLADKFQLNTKLDTKTSREKTMSDFAEEEQRLLLLALAEHRSLAAKAELKSSQSLKAEQQSLVLEDQHSSLTHNEHRSLGSKTDLKLAQPARTEQNVNRADHNSPLGVRLDQERHKSPVRAKQKSPHSATSSHGVSPHRSSPHTSSPHGGRSDRESPAAGRSERLKSPHHVVGSVHQPSSHSSSHSSTSAYISQSIYRYSTTRRLQQ